MWAKGSLSCTRISLCGCGLNPHKEKKTEIHYFDRLEQIFLFLPCNETGCQCQLQVHPRSEVLAEKQIKVLTLAMEK